MAMVLISQGLTKGDRLLFGRRGGRSFCYQIFLKALTQQNLFLTGDQLLTAGGYLCFNPGIP
ncbi:MAG: hypothetical protein PUP91_13735 [Rhizonema sp. PD37]|nr:hypothetical protein [Rhizonema sp. PD37]